jgi:hypothetical protein
MFDKHYKFVSEQYETFLKIYYADEEYYENDDFYCMMNIMSDSFFHVYHGMFERAFIYAECFTEQMFLNFVTNQHFLYGFPKFIPEGTISSYFFACIKV